MTEHPLGFDSRIQPALDAKANQTGGTATITGGGTISLAGYTLTVPATGTALVKTGALTAGYIPFGVAGSLVGEDAGITWNNIYKTLCVGSATVGSRKITATDTSTSNSVIMEFIAPGGKSLYVGYDTDGTNATLYRIRTGGSIDLRLGDSADNNLITISGLQVGIGATVPAARLHVQGAGTGGAITAILRAHATTPGDLLQLQKSDGTVYSGVNATGGQYGKLATTTKTADYTATVSDRCVTANKATAITITLPAATGSGQTISITSIGAGACTVDGNSSETINGETTQVLYLHESITVHDYGTGTWEVI